MIGNMKIRSVCNSKTYERWEKGNKYNDMKGNKEESEGKKVDQFWEIYLREGTLYVILSS